MTKSASTRQHTGMTAKTSRYLEDSIKETLNVTEHKQYNSDGPDTLIFRYGPSFFTEINLAANNDEFIGLTPTQIANSSLTTEIEIFQFDKKIVAKMQTISLPLAKIPHNNPFITYLASLSLSKTVQHTDLIWKIPIDMNQALLAYRRNQKYKASKTTSARYQAILTAIITTRWNIDGQHVITTNIRQLGDKVNPNSSELFRYEPRHFVLNVNNEHTQTYSIKPGHKLNTVRYIEPQTPYFWSIANRSLSWLFENDALDYSEADNNNISMVYYPELNLMKSDDALFPTDTQFTTLYEQANETKFAPELVREAYNAYLDRNLHACEFQDYCVCQIRPLYAKTEDIDVPLADKD